jgi:hypothetical protein
MPRIDDLILNSIVYLYPSVTAAENGDGVGGTGFLVAVPSATAARRHYSYAVTNSHVIREAKAPVIRLNRPDKGTIVLDLAVDDWTHHPNGDDVAITGPLLLEPTKVQASLLPLELFITEGIIQDQEIGPGDDTFMIGRFKAHEGRERNLPTVRFGSISMMPLEPVRHQRGIKQESFLVETRSLGGYSGSPVFVHIPSSSVRPKDRLKRRERQVRGITADLTDDLEFSVHGESGPWLLGIDYGHLPLFDAVLERDHKTPVDSGYVAASNSGLMGVVPAWRLAELLNSPEIEKVRQDADAQLANNESESPTFLESERGSIQE